MRYTVFLIWKLIYMFRVVLSPIIRSANNCIYSICHLSHRYCYLPLSWKSWNRFECTVGGVFIVVTVRASCLHHSVKSSVFTNMKTTAKLTNLMWNFYFCWHVGPLWKLQTFGFQLWIPNGLAFSFYFTDKVEAFWFALCWYEDMVKKS
jgi:hypothetical protein